MRIRWLLPEERRQKAGNATNFHFKDVVRRSSGGAAGREGLVSGAGDGEFHEPRLWRGGNERDRPRQITGPDVLHQRQDQTVGQIVRDLEAFSFGFLLSVL